jgi:hypothetical protein
MSCCESRGFPFMSVIGLFAGAPAFTSGEASSGVQSFGGLVAPDGSP